MDTLNAYSLLHILQYLDAEDIMHLETVLPNIGIVTETTSLWNNINCTRGNASNELVAYALRKLQISTISLRMTSEKPFMTSLVLARFSMCQNLTILDLGNQVFNGEKIRLQNFPKTLHELSLSNCHFLMGKTFFRLRGVCLPHLRVLILENCFNLRSSAFGMLRLMPDLEIFSLKGTRFAEVTASDLHVSCRKVKVLDLRGTGIRTFRLPRNNSLTEVYYSPMHNPQLSHDYLQLLQGEQNGALLPYIPPQSVLYKRPIPSDALVDILKSIAKKHQR